MMMKLIVALCILVLMAGCASVDAFVTPTSTAATTLSVTTTTTTTAAPSVTTSTELYAANGPPDTATKDIPYGEISRQYRRTVYTHDDWVKHRSPNRFIKNLFTIFNSGVYKVRTVYVYVYVYVALYLFESERYAKAMFLSSGFCDTKKG
jgi:uncharacterized protein YceK